jgi:predicted secreted hydrolase
MKRKSRILGVAFLLIVLAMAAWWQPWRFLFEIETDADKTFSNTVSQKDTAFSDILSNKEEGFARALQPITFFFPKNHGAHPQYRTEWWYFTGNLNSSDGRQFGYQLTFFRFALSPEHHASKSCWRNNQLYMAHLTLTDVMNKQFYTDERFSRAGNELAGAASTDYHVWLYDWSAQAEKTTDFPLHVLAKNDQFAIDLELTPVKNLILQGDQGLSQKSAEPGNASYYYSYPRLATQGMLKLAGQNIAISGYSWMDREWSTSALSREQSGWDWFALQLSDNTELMYYQLRRKDGQPDSHRAGSVALSDRSKVTLTRQDVIIKVLDFWQSPHSKVRYPARWHMSVSRQQLELDIVPLLNDQELNVSYRYWEGAVSIAGTKAGKTITGRGYVELTGY